MHGKGDSALPVGRYEVTKYGHTWRIITIEPAPDAAPVKAPRSSTISPESIKVPAPAVVPDDSGPAEPEPMTLARWRGMSLEARVQHIRHFTDCKTEEERQEWESELR